MRTTKKYAVLTAVIAILILTQSAVFAQPNLKDIKGHWAEKEIQQMVDSKFILGYPDGTFKPDNPVTKLDALIMAARVLGVDKAENSEEAITAQDTYKTMLASYDIYGKREISFLLNRNVFTKTEIDTYIKGSNAKLNTKRYEAAVIFTKILGEEKNIQNKAVIILPFMDSQQIPSAARSYVELMNEQGIMNGVTKTEFKPNDTVTRAQMAVLLLRVNNKLNGQGTQTAAEGTTTTFSGTIDYINKATMLVIVKDSTTSKSFTLTSDTSVKIDNSSSSFNALERGFTVVVKAQGTRVTEVSAASRIHSKTITGIVSSIVTNPSAKIGIKEDIDADDSETYSVDTYVEIVKDGSNTTIDGLSLKDFGTFYITTEGKLGKIVVEKRTKKVSGTVENLTIDDKVYLTIKVNGKESIRYEVLSDVSVERNGAKSSMKDIKVGDTVELVLEYNKVETIDAESDQKTIEGTIEEITISKDSKLVVKVGTKTAAYSLSADAVIKVDNVASTIYDLRLGTKAKIELDSNVVILVKAEKKVEVLEVRGTIKLINLSLGLITIEGDNGETSQIYVDSKETKVTDIEEASTIKLSALEEGQKIIAYGKNDRGVFVTAMILLAAK